jgi:uncharacterized protein YggU (UPF0235/DUF167 family)
VRLRVQPGARSRRIEGAAILDDGAVVLKVRLDQPAAEGRANAALIALLAKSWRLSKSTLEIVGGARARRKTLHVAGDPAALERHLAAWLGRLPQ